MRITARGPLAIVALVLLAGVRHLFVESMAPAEAVSVVRAEHAREVSAHYLPLVKTPAGTVDPQVAQAFADALEAVERERYANVRVKRTWIPPIMVRRPTYLVALTRGSSSEPEYYRVRGPFARQTSRLAWLFPIL